MARRTPSVRTVVITSGAMVVLGVGAVVGITAWADGTPPADAAGPGRASAAVSPFSSAAPGTQAPPGAGLGPAEDGAGPQATTSATPIDASELSPGVPQTPPTQPAPAPPPTGPSLTGPLPPSASAHGEQLVAGFPAQVVPVLDGIRVVSSSVAGEGTRLQAGIEASSSAAPATVISRYAATFRQAGFVVASAPALPGSTAVAFTRGPDGGVLTVTDRLGGGTELTIAATLTTTG